MEQKISYIEVNRILPHPDNPRKNLGDLTDLTASILAKGILQNLTVVPKENPISGEYDDKWFTCVIGHRRLAAAQEAGLETVPAVIAGLSKQEQVETMLLENIERADLTPLEEAIGFQMMMDFGNSVKDIVEKTGFSDSKVRHRLEIAKLPREVVETKVENGAQLMDFIALERIKNAENKEKALAMIGTSKFYDFVDEYVQEELVDANLEKFMAWVGLETNLSDTPPDEYERWQLDRIATISLIKYENDINCLDPSVIVDGVYYAIDKIYSKNISIYALPKPKEDEDIDREKTPEELEKEAIDLEFKERVEKMKAVEARCREKRILWMQTFSNESFNSQSDNILRYVTDSIIDPDSDLEFMDPRDEIIKKLLMISDEDIEGIIENENYPNINSSRDIDLRSFFDCFANILSKTKKAAYIIFSSLETDFAYYYSYNHTIKRGAEYYRDHPGSYQFLKMLGYNMNEEEQALFDGIHELYDSGDEED